MSEFELTWFAILAFVAVLVGMALAVHLRTPKCPKCGRRDGIELRSRVCVYCGEEWNR